MNKEERRIYNNNRYYKRKEKMFDILGRECAFCGASESLEIDHKDPKTKKYELSMIWDKQWALIESELVKCQVLCKECHIQKTIKDFGKNIAKGKHGRISSYRYCKCDLCKEAKNKYMRLYKKRRRSSAG